MFSYRHAFHAGNHADVLKHSVILAVLQYLQKKPVALTIVDTHAGAGIYHLSNKEAQTSAEYLQGIAPLLLSDLTTQQALSPMLQQYVQLVMDFNPGGELRHYPGSPMLVQHLLREQDRQKIFEIHPTDVRLLRNNIQQLPKKQQIQMLVEDGFQGSLKFLPPPSKRALVLVDPSYEMKTDYQRVVEFLTNALKRFVTGTYIIWYPIVPRPQAHTLPKKLKQVATKAGCSWLHTSLAVRSAGSKHYGEKVGMVASGIFVVNPPFTLQPQLQQALPQLKQALGQDHLANFVLEVSK